jgi:hypothetical protein
MISYIMLNIMEVLQEEHKQARITIWKETSIPIPALRRKEGSGAGDVPEV